MSAHPKSFAHPKKFARTFWQTVVPLTTIDGFYLKFAFVHCFENVKTSINKT